MDDRRKSICAVIRYCHVVEAMDDQSMAFLCIFYKTTRSKLHLLNGTGRITLIYE